MYYPPKRKKDDINFEFLIKDSNGQELDPSVVFSDLFLDIYNGSFNSSIKKFSLNETTGYTTLTQDSNTLQGVILETETEIADKGRYDGFFTYTLSGNDNTTQTETKPFFELIGEKDVCYTKCYDSDEGTCEINIEITLDCFTMNITIIEGQAAELVQFSNELNFNTSKTMYLYDEPETIVFSLGTEEHLTQNTIRVELGSTVTGIDLTGLDYSISKGAFDNTITAGEVNIIYFNYVHDDFLDIVIEQGLETPEQPLTQLDAPVLSALVVDSSTDITASWSQITNNSGYTLEYKKTTDTLYTSITIAQDTITHQITGLDAGTQYDVRVVAKGDGITYSDSDPSNVEQGTTDSLPLLDTPVLNAATMGYSTADLDCDQVTDNDGYEWYYKLQSSGTWILADTTTADDNTYQITGLDAGEDYDFSVIAIGDNVSYQDSLRSNTIQDSSLAWLDDIAASNESYSDGETVTGVTNNGTRSTALTVQNTPTFHTNVINSQPVYRLNGTDESFYIDDDSADGLAEITVISVFKSNSNAAQQVVYRASHLQHVVHVDSMRDIARRDTELATRNIDITNQDPSGLWIIMATRVDFQNRVIKSRIIYTGVDDSYVETNPEFTSGVTQDDGYLGLIVGAQGSSGSPPHLVFFNGDIAEYKSTNTYLSDADFLTEVDALKTKYNIG